jgi:Lipopolysaccharide-assembly
MRLDRGCILACLTVVLLQAVGCSYSTERPFRDDIQTVSVEMFHTKDFRREFEFNLTEALAKRVELDTPYRVASRERADSVISGEIIQIEQRTLGNDFDTDLPREMGATFVVRWRWKDLRTGEIIRDYPRFVHTTTYIPPVGESINTSRVRGIDRLAERMVEAMEKPW